MSYTIYAPRIPGGFPKNIKGVLFDMDGLVLDTEVLYQRFWIQACHYYGYPMTKSQALGMRSIGEKDGSAKLKSWFSPEVDYHQVRNKRIELMNAFIEKEGVIPKPGVRELLAFLKEQGIRTAIATSSPLDRAKAHLGSVGLDVLFDKICSGRQVAAPKPAPDIYRFAAQSLGFAPEECLALEDSPAGIEAAFRAGCLPVMIPDLDQPDSITLSRLYAKCDSLTDVISLLKQ